MTFGMRRSRPELPLPTFLSNSPLPAFFFLFFHAHPALGYNPKGGCAFLFVFFFFLALHLLAPSAAGSSNVKGRNL